VCVCVCVSYLIKNVFFNPTKTTYEADFTFE